MDCYPGPTKRFILGVCFCLALLCRISLTQEQVNFLDVVTDNEVQIRDRALQVNGKIPDYVNGSLIRNGPAKWRVDGYYFGHLFDGAGKLTKWKVGGNGNNGTVQFSAQMLDSSLYRDMKTKSSIPKIIGSGPVLDRNTNQPRVGGPLDLLFSAILTFLFYENSNINVWDYSPGNDDRLWTTTDVSPLAMVNFNLETLQAGISAPSPSGGNWFDFLSEYTACAHPEYCKNGSGATYRVSSFVGVFGMTTALIREEPGLTQRTVVASIRNVDQTWIPFTSGTPYVHSFALTPTRALVLIHPIRVPTPVDLLRLVRDGFFRGSSIVDDTYLWVIDLATGENNLQKISEPVYSYHMVSATDEGNGFSSVRMVAYDSFEFLTGENHFIRMDRLDNRNDIPKPGRVVEIRTDGTSVTSVEWQQYSGFTGFEFPVQRYSRSTAAWTSTQHPRYIYGVAMYADGKDTFESWGLIKIDSAAATFQNPDVFMLRDNSQYYSEPIFVADPKGASEDDGVLLSSVYDGNRRETYLLVVNATSMVELARAYSGYRGTADFHGAFFAGQ